MSTSTEIAVRAGGRSLPEKIEYAKYLAASGLLPAQYRDRPANVLYATEFGDMIGIPTMASILGVHVIEGKPSASAALISALVRRAGHRIRTWGDDEKAVTEIVRSDDPDFTYRVEWTMGRARRAELTGKGTWKKYPAALLKARTVTECARDACQEVLFGLQYTPEELGAEVDADGLPVQATATRVDPADEAWASKPATAHERATGEPEPAGTQDPGEAAPTAETSDEPDWDALVAEVEQTGNVTPAWKLARQHRPDDMALRERIQTAGQKRRQPAPEPAADTPAAADEPVDAEIVDEPATQKQRNHMHALWSKAEATREERLEVTSHLIGRDVESSNDLTGAEADTVIGELTQVSGTPAKLYSAVSRWLAERAEASGAKPDGVEVES